MDDPGPESIVLADRNAAESVQLQPDLEQSSFKITSAAFSFFVAGVNDGSLGSLLPYVLKTWDLSTNLVVVIYAATFSGWLVSALANSSLRQYLGLGAILTLGAALQTVAHALRSWMPPFALYTVTFFLASLGQAFNDTHANTFVSSLRSAHRWLGVIHAMYMAGCLVGPLVATAIATANSKWYLFYVVALGLGVINTTLIAIAFRDQMTCIRRSHIDQSGQSVGRVALQEMKNTLRLPVVWIMSLYFFFFLGAAITSGGWVADYLVKVRHGKLSEMGYIPTGLYGGAFLGRLLLAEPTYRLGERRMVVIYALLCVCLQLVFWLVPNIIAEAVAISFLGFFSGPFFATGISVASKLFPAEIKSSGVAFVFVIGQIGGSIFPILTGVIASRAGVQVLQPMLVALLGAAGGTWLLLPKKSTDIRRAS